MGDRKVFPINNQAACVWKWGWNTFRLYNGKSSSCHRVQPIAVSIENFDNFHNTPEVINDRKQMLANQWPGRGCEYCQHIEQAGGTSDRTYHNQMEGLTPLDFEQDNLHVTPRILELYLNNTCDLACVYCIPIYSSKINDELKRYGPLPTVDIKAVDRIENHTAYLEKMLAWLESYSTKLQRLSIQGGEPFLQPEFDILLTWLENHNNPELELSFNTNLNERPGIIEGYVERLKSMLIQRRIKRVDFNCSIDCWGPRQEFIRYGLNLTRWQHNFEYLLKHRWIHVHAGHVVTSLSIKTLPDLLQRLNDYRAQGHKFYQTFGHVDGKNELLYDPSIFGGKFFKQHLLDALALTPDGQDKTRLAGIAKQIDQSQPDRLRLNKLYVTLNHIDQRRKTNWRGLFPEIEQYFLENGISDVV